MERADEERFGSLQKGCAEGAHSDPEPRRTPACDHLFHCGAGDGSFSVGYDGTFRLCCSLWHPDCTVTSVTRAAALELREAWEELVPRVRDLRSQRCRVPREVPPLPAGQPLPVVPGARAPRERRGSTDGSTRCPSTSASVAHARAAALAPSRPAPIRSCVDCRCGRQPMRRACEARAPLPRRRRSLVVVVRRAAGEPDPGSLTKALGHSSGRAGRPAAAGTGCSPPLVCTGSTGRLCRVVLRDARRRAAGRGRDATARSCAAGSPRRSLLMSREALAVTRLLRGRACGRCSTKVRRSPSRCTATWQRGAGATSTSSSPRPATCRPRTLRGARGFVPARPRGRARRCADAAPSRRSASGTRDRPGDRPALAGRTAVRRRPPRRRGPARSGRRRARCSDGRSWCRRGPTSRCSRRSTPPRTTGRDSTTCSPWRWR